MLMHIGDMIAFETLKHEPCTLHPELSILNPEPCTLHPAP